MSTNDRPETLTPDELREQSESWRHAALAWQAWAARVLSANGKQPKGGEHGDDVARAVIEALTRKGRTKPSIALEAAALAYARAHRALQRATPKPWIILTPALAAKIEAKRLAMVRAEGALKVAARAMGRARK